MDDAGTIHCSFYRNIASVPETDPADLSIVLVNTSLVLSSFHLQSAVQHALYHSKTGRFCSFVS